VPVLWWVGDGRVQPASLSSAARTGVYCKYDDYGKTSWRDALEKAQYVRWVSPAVIFGLEPVPEGMVACIVGLGVGVSRGVRGGGKARCGGTSRVAAGTGVPGSRRSLPRRWRSIPTKEEAVKVTGASRSVGRCRCGKGLCGPKGRPQGAEGV
jgi:hypothetical protein